MAVLIVDDNKFVRRAYQASLAMKGFDVDVASSGQEGLARLGAGAYDVIVTDVKMPGMSGIDFLRAVRDIDPDLPVILMTGTPTIHSAAEAVEHRAYRYLTKSAQMDDLVDTVRRAGKYYSLARLKRQALAAGGAATWEADAGTLERSFNSALGQLWIAFQPIV